MAQDGHGGSGLRHGMTGAESLLTGLKRNGIDYLFANAGTDFPPIIEALASLDEASVPLAVTVPHETAGVGMAHGYYLVTGRPQATMVHVNVGLANAAMGIINARSDDIPMVILSGRTPITEGGRPGARQTQIQYGQEMYDQSSLVADVVKFHYEMRYPEQGDMLASRGISLAMSEPKGPVYVSLPRESLAETVAPEAAMPMTVQVPASPTRPDPEAVTMAAEWLSEARSPLIICQRGDVESRLADAIRDMVHAFAIPVVEPYSIRNLLASDDDMLLGYDPKSALEGADAVLVVDSAVPWIEKLHRPGPDTRIIHLGPDPHFQRNPIRSYRCDLAIAADATAGIAAIHGKMRVEEPVIARRRALIGERSAARRARSRELAEAGCAAPMSAEWLSRCVGEIMDDRAVVFSELGVIPGSMELKGPNRVFSNPHSGGLGWALPAALGAQLADRARLCIACVGDGSYMFANPVVCHQIAEALELPVLTIVKNNGMWNAVRRAVIGSYPQGAAARANRMPLTSLDPSPDYTAIAAASRAHTERIEHGRDLPAALARALAVIREDGRQALVEVATSVSDAS